MKSATSMMANQNADTTLSITTAVKRKKEEASGSKSNFPCLFCEKSCGMVKCRTFATVETRKQKLKDLERCFICLAKDHLAMKLPMKKCQCTKCRNSGHHYALCDNQMKEDTFLQTFTSSVGHTNTRLVCRGVIDSGNDTSYIIIKLVQKLGATVDNSMILKTGTITVHLKDENGVEKACDLFHYKRNSKRNIFLTST